MARPGSSSSPTSRRRWLPGSRSCSTILSSPSVSRRRPRTWWRRNTGWSRWSKPSRTYTERFSVADTITTRHLDESDVLPVLDLMRAALGEPPLLRRTPELFAWKHFDNPFGRSLAVVAETDDRIV